MSDFLHARKDFDQLLALVADERGLDPMLVEKDFMREPAYEERKAQRFRIGDEQEVARNQAFVLGDAAQRERFALEYRKTQALYYQGQPDFDTLVARIHQYIDVM